MHVCTLFGHRACPESIRPQLKSVLRDLILYQNVSLFYVGNQGRFDAIAHSVLRELRQEYPHIDYAVVLAYMPGKRCAYKNAADTMLPEGIEAVHPRYAISWRNHWMLKQADYAVTYIAHHWGGAAQYYQKALRMGIPVINLPGANELCP